MRSANVFSAECVYDPGDPAGFQSAAANISEALGARALAVKTYEVPPDEALCPYHYEYEEEWLVVLDGTVIVRTPDGESEISRGEAVCFEPGPGGAHKVLNRSNASARVLMFSSAREPAVAVYPDSDKIGVWPGNEQDNVMVRRADGGVDYWDGERSE